MEKIQKLTFLLSVAVLVFLAITPVCASAATLGFSPSSGSYAVGNTFAVNVVVASPDQAINATSGTISFPQNLLQVVSVSKAASILNLWVTPPSFSNAEGTVDFQGVVLNPGFTGAYGNIVTINFKVKAAGSAPLSFSSSSSVLANDGLGTEVLSNSGTANFTLTNQQQNTSLPPAPDIQSSTHPDQTAWYPVPDAVFNWQLPPGISAVRILFNRFADSVPVVVYNPPISSKDIGSVTDGVWYFHAQFENSAGWGPVSHFKFQIDTQKPTQFTVVQVPEQDATDPKPSFTLTAQDATSGIDHYEIQIDNGPVQSWTDDGSHIYQAPLMLPGQHTLSAKAVDKAGNWLAASVNFAVASINPPTITDYTKSLQGAGSLMVHGSTYPDSTVTIWLKPDNGSQKSFALQSSGDGSFGFVDNEKLASGNYTLWATVTDARGAQSTPSQTVTVSVTNPTLAFIIGWLVGILSLVVPFIALLVLLILIIWFGWNRFWVIMKKSQKEANENNMRAGKVFGALRDNLRQQIKILEKISDKEGLTEKEREETISRLKDYLDEAEKFVSWEMKNKKK